MTWKLLSENPIFKSAIQKSSNVLEPKAIVSLNIFVQMVYSDPNVKVFECQCPFQKWILSPTNKQQTTNNKQQTNRYCLQSFSASVRHQTQSQITKHILYMKAQLHIHAVWQLDNANIINIFFIHLEDHKHLKGNTFSYIYI